ncbi:MAG: fused MFS/spermidine synthase [Elusimicrobiota bacterium]
MAERLPYLAAVFLASFLTFVLELAAAKMLLPRFGGSAYVWTTCVIFFQGLLLAAYVGSHAALSRWDARRHAQAHRILLIVPFFFFPLRLPAALPSAGPLADLLWALSLSVGVPFLILSTTVPVVSGWLMRSSLPEREDVSFLFGASNLGALCALLAYPFLIEPFLPLKSQSLAWFALYAVYAGVYLRCCPRSFAVKAAAEAPRETPTALRRAQWLLLSAAPCAAMLATTNLLTFDFAAVPLLWVAPLAVYLFTFVLNFKRKPWYPGRLNSALLPLLGVWTAACLSLAALAVLHAGNSTPIQTLRRLADIGQFGYMTAALFVVGMICHKSLAASRPSSERGTTEFYAWVAFGGFLGSACVGILVPWLGRGTGALALDWIAAGALALAALIARDWDGVSGFARRRPALAAALLAATAAAGLGARLRSGPADGVVFSLRNFYGVYRVVDHDGVRMFYHGNTDHGMQSLDPPQGAVPMSYYNLRSPLFEVYDALGKNWRRVGVVGLGAGTLAAYGRPGTAMDFYELDPDVALIAERWFTYLKLSRSENRIILGDARLSLERADGTVYDLLVLDAFNSGAIPIHLVTKEALELYLRRISPDGVILLHVSNRYLDLRPMLAAAARELGLAGASKRLAQNGRVTDGRVPSSWVALSRDAGKMNVLTRARGWAPLQDSASTMKPWSDQHASLLPVLSF